MKTVTGAVLSSKPIPLSKAAKILSKFASADNGASPACAHYLKRASQSFEEALQARNELASRKHRSDESTPSFCEAAESKENGGEIGLDDRRDEAKRVKKKRKSAEIGGDNGDVRKDSDEKMRNKKRKKGKGKGGD